MSSVKNAMPSDPIRMQRAMLALDGLSVGDAFGQKFFGRPDTVVDRIDSRELPRAPWHYTDDTEMALGITDILRRHGRIDPDALASAFAERYRLRPNRGYGGTAHEILRSIGEGMSWADASGQAFDGMGSMGNGAAMRVAPVGAYFADDLARVVMEADLSAEVTHAHRDGRAGGIAIAVAAAIATGLNGRLSEDSGLEMLDEVLRRTPRGGTHEGILKARHLDLELSAQTAASFLGNGSRVISEDTVPFALWCAARHLGDFREAMWTTVSGLGDRDTTCAIVGGIVAMSAGRESIPDEWLAAREELKFDEDLPNENR